MELLRDLAKEGRTVIVVTHDLGIARQADLQIELEDGQIRRMMTIGAGTARARRRKNAPKHWK